MCVKVIWNKQELEKALSVALVNDVAVTGVSIDSRTVQAGDLFVAIKGEHFDGHAYVASAIEKGAVAALVSDMPADGDDSAILIHVDDTLNALAQLAIYRRSQLQGKVIGVTGSVGKTSTKEMLTHMLCAQGKTHATFGNLNNHIGVPLTMARLPADSAYAIIEMGMNHPGEIEPLTLLAKPDVALVTTVESVHLENFENEQSIAHEKAEIFKGLKSGGVAILNRDNVHYDYMHGLVKQMGVQLIEHFGVHAKTEAQLLDYSENDDHSASVVARIHNQNYHFNMGVVGKHQAVNAVAALLAISAVGADVEQAAHTLLRYCGTEGRGIVHAVKRKNNGTFYVMDDSYNASPASVSAALNVLQSYAERLPHNARKIAVLGDMFELGPQAPELHAGLLSSVIANNVDKVFTAGALMQHLFEVLPKEMQGGHFATSKALAAALPDALKSHDVILVKGSHGMHMNDIVDRLKEEHNAL